MRTIIVTALAVVLLTACRSVTFEQDSIHITVSPAVAEMALAPLTAEMPLDGAVQGEEASGDRMQRGFLTIFIEMNGDSTSDAQATVDATVTPGG